MRLSIIIASALAFAVAAASAIEAPRNGAYVSLTTTSAAACARACADDGICMAWTFRTANACELSATVSASPAPDALASGFSSRAPAFALRTTTPSPVQIAVTAPVAEPHATESPPEAESELMTASADADVMLLGGPEEGDLRLRLGVRR